MKKILVIPDTHRPYHDKKAWDLMLHIATDWKPNELVVLGDFGDFAQVATYVKDQRKIVSFDKEVEDVNVGLDELTAIGAKKNYFLEGNHEVRVEKRLLEKWPEMVSHIPTAEHLLKMHQRRKWSWHSYGDYIELGNMSFSHDVGHCGKTAVTLNAHTFGANIIAGHCHRAGVHYWGNIHEGTRVSVVSGWLGDRDAIHYMHRPRTKDWQLGFTTIYQDKMGLSWVNFVPIVNNKCIFEGKEYK